jgi:hypothetical protein
MPSEAVVSAKAMPLHSMASAGRLDLTQGRKAAHPPGDCPEALVAINQAYFLGQLVLDNLGLLPLGGKAGAEEAARSSEKLPCGELI